MWKREDVARKMTRKKPGRKQTKQNAQAGRVKSEQAVRMDVRKARVSQALWPPSFRRALPLNHVPFKYGRISMLRRCRNWFADRLRWAHRTPRWRRNTPITPMPLEPPLVRVLETIDLSRIDLEHSFVESEEERHTAELSLEWTKDLPLGQ